VTSGIGLILSEYLVEVLEVYTESQGTILFFAKETGHRLVIRQSDEPLAEHVVENSRKRLQFCAREWVDVAMRRFWSFSM